MERRVPISALVDDYGMRTSGRDAVADRQQRIELLLSHDVQICFDLRRLQTIVAGLYFHEKRSCATGSNYLNHRIDLVVAIIDREWDLHERRNRPGWGSEWLEEFTTELVHRAQHGGQSRCRSNLPLLRT